MSNFYHDNDDLRLYLNDGLDWASLVEVTEDGFRSAEEFKDTEEALTFYQEIAETLGSLAMLHAILRARALHDEITSIGDERLARLQSR